MIIWHAPTEPPKEGVDLMVLYDSLFGIQRAISTYDKEGGFNTGIALVFDKQGNLRDISNDDVLAWTEYNMPEWVNSNRKEKE